MTLKRPPYIILRFFSSKCFISGLILYQNSQFIDLDVTWRHYRRQFCSCFWNIHKVTYIWPKNDHHTSFWDFFPQNIWYLGWFYARIVNLSILTSHDVIIDVIFLKISIKSLIFDLKTTNIYHFERSFLKIFYFWD